MSEKKESPTTVEPEASSSKQESLEAAAMKLQASIAVVGTLPKDCKKIMETFNRSNIEDLPVQGQEQASKE